MNQCPILHRFLDNTHVDVKNDELKAIKATMRLSWCHVHALMFEVGIYFWSLTTKNPIVKEATIYLGQRCHAI